MVGAVAAVMLALLLGLGLSLFLFVREREARHRAVKAEREQARLREQAELALGLQARLQEQTESSAKLDAAGRAFGEGKYEEAEKLLLEVPAHPSSASLYISLGTIFARRGEWPQAITNFSIAVDLVPSEHIPHYHLAVLLLKTGDKPAYEAHRQRILERFAEPRTAFIAQRMAMACLLFPPSTESAPAVEKLVAAAMTLPPKRDPPPEFKFLKGLAEYRAGHFSSAVDWLRKMDLRSVDQWHAVQAWMVMAMAHQQLGHSEEARDALAKGRQLGTTTAPKGKNRDLGLTWSEWIIAQALKHEAEPIVEGKNADTKP